MMAHLYRFYPSFAPEDVPPMPPPPSEPPRFVDPILVEPPRVLSLTERRAFEQRIVRHVERSGARNFVCDCRHLDAIDLPGWGVLIRVTEYTQRCGGSFVLKHLAPALVSQMEAVVRPGRLVLWAPDDVSLGGDR